MHATTEQLLSLRDRQPVDAAAAAHVAGCPHCQQALAGLQRMRERLKALPGIEPPPELWRMVTTVQPARDGWQRGRWSWLAGLAASFVLGIALLLNLGETPDDGPMPGTTTDLIAATPAPQSSLNGISRAELIETSRYLEAALRALPAAPQVTRASTALTIAELQDRIFEIDLLLNDPRLEPVQERALWQQRVRLMDTLMQVRFAQLSDVH